MELVSLSEEWKLAFQIRPAIFTILCPINWLI
jgi:hypothetical protein